MVAAIIMHSSLLMQQYQELEQGGTLAFTLSPHR